MSFSCSLLPTNANGCPNGSSCSLHKAQNLNYKTDCSKSWWQTLASVWLNWGQLNNDVGPWDDNAQSSTLKLI